MQDYLNNIHTLQSRFEQVSNDGGVATGTIYLSRPGKMRVTPAMASARSAPGPRSPSASSSPARPT